MPAAVETTFAYKTVMEIQRVVVAFESCTLPRAVWNHQAHLTIAAWYLFDHPKALATNLIRQGIKAYNQSVGIATTKTSGYHETITLFYVELIDAYLTTTGRNSIVESTNGLLRSYGDPQIPLTFYSTRRLMSWEARLGWVDPDLRPLEFGITSRGIETFDERLIDTIEMVIDGRRYE